MRIFFVVSYGDTVTMEDTECSERLAFAINTNTENFYYSGDSLNSVNGFYEVGVVKGSLYIRILKLK